MTESPQKPSDYVDYSEWIFSGRWRDYGERIATCELCGQIGLRYHFEIVYRGNNTPPPPMWVGSVCINKFGVTVRDEKGRKIRRNLVAKYLREFIKKRKQKVVLSTVYTLLRGGAEDGIRLWQIYERLRDKGVLSPFNAVWLLRLAPKHGLNLPPHFLTVSLRSNRDQQEMKHLYPQNFRLIAPALSPAQLRTAKRLRSEDFGVIKRLRKK